MLRRDWYRAWFGRRPRPRTESEPRGAHRPRARVFPDAGPFAGAVLIVASVALAFSVEDAGGHFSRLAVGFLWLALLSGIAAAGLAGRETRSEASLIALSTAALFALGVQVTFIQWSDSLYYARGDAGAWLQAYRTISGWLFAVGVALLAWGFVSDRPILCYIRRSLLFLAFLYTAVWTVHVSPSPAIDVFQVGQAASHSLLHLDNPYHISVPSIYLRGTTMDFYPYPPMVAVVQAPFYAIFHDVRFTQVTAMAITAAALIRLAERSGLPSAAADTLAALALLHPTVPYILEQAWVDPIGAAFLATAVLAYRSQRLVLSTLLFGFALASKQYLAALIPVLIVLPGFGWRRVVGACAAAGAVIVPFFLWGPRAFWYGVVQHHLGPAPLESGTSDSIAFYLASKGVYLPEWVGYVLWVGVAIGVSYWRRSRPAGPWIALALSLLCFFAFGKQAFANYYWLVGVFFVLAACLLFAQPEPARPDQGTPVPLALPQKNDGGTGDPTPPLSSQPRRV